MESPIFQNDAEALGVLMAILGFIFYTNTLKTGFWPKFYKLFPMLLLCYILPALATTFGLISPEWLDLDSMIEGFKSMGKPLNDNITTEDVEKMLAAKELSAEELSPFKKKNSL